MLPHIATNDTTLSSFQCKILNNVLSLNNKLYTFGIKNTALGSFYQTLEETLIHTFYDCIYGQSLWERLQVKSQNDTILPSLTTQTNIIGLANDANNTFNYLSHKLLVFKYYIYISREKQKRDPIKNLKVY